MLTTAEIEEAISRAEASDEGFVRRMALAETDDDEAASRLVVAGSSSRASSRCLPSRTSSGASLAA